MKTLLAVVMVGSSSILAQTPNPGSTVRITTATERVTGKVAAADSGVIRIITPSQARLEFTRSEVTRLEVRGHRTKGGAIVGGFAGAAAGIGFVAALATDCEVARCGTSEVPGAMLTGGIVLGTVGAATGALIGWMIPRWSTAAR